MLKEPRAKNVGGNLGENSSLFGVFAFSGGVHVVIEARPIAWPDTCIGGVTSFWEIVSTRWKRKTGSAAPGVARGGPGLVIKGPGVIAGQRGRGPVFTLKQTKIWVKNKWKNIRHLRPVLCPFLSVFVLCVWHSKFVICWGSHASEWSVQAPMAIVPGAGVFTPSWIILWEFCDETETRGARLCDNDWIMVDPPRDPVSCSFLSNVPVKSQSYK